MYKYGPKLDLYRQKQNINKDSFAKMMNLRTQTAAGVLAGKLKAPDKVKRDKVYKALKLSKEEISEFESLALLERGEISDDIQKYLTQCPSALEAIYMAMDSREGDDFWEQVKGWLGRMNSK